MEAARELDTVRDRLQVMERKEREAVEALSDLQEQLTAEQATGRSSSSSSRCVFCSSPEGERARARRRAHTFWTDSPQHIDVFVVCVRILFKLP